MEYVLLGGDEGAKRLRMLNNAYWPTSKAILIHSGIKPGVNYLDVGCGAGDMILRVANLLEKKGMFAGIDKDERALQIAHQVAQEAQVNADFQMVDIESNKWNISHRYDFVYSRSVLTHLRHPLVALSGMYEATAEGGTILVEDIEFEGSFCYPYFKPYYQFCEYYEAIVKKRGADPNIGPKLYQMFLDTGIRDIQIRVSQPTFFSGDGKLIAHVTLEHISGALIDAKIATPAEINKVVQELKVYAADSRTLMSFPRVFQLWGKKI